MKMHCLFGFNYQNNTCPLLRFSSMDFICLYREKKLRVDLNRSTRTVCYHAPVYKWLYCICALESSPERQMNRVAMDT